MYGYLWAFMGISQPKPSSSETATPKRICEGILHLKILGLHQEPCFSKACASKTALAAILVPPVDGKVRVGHCSWEKGGKHKLLDWVPENGAVQS